MFLMAMQAGTLACPGKKVFNTKDTTYTKDK